MKKIKKFWSDYDPEYKAALNAIHKHTQNIGWKGFNPLYDSNGKNSKGETDSISPPQPLNPSSP